MNNIDIMIEEENKNTTTVAISQHSRKNAIVKKRNGTRHAVKYDSGLADKIVSLITQGKSLTHILSFKEMPSTNTFYNWMDEHPELKTNYTIARARKAHYLVESALEAPKQALDEVRLMDAADKRCNAIVQAHRLVADTNIKVASLYNKSEYGDAPFIAAPSQIGVQVVFGPCVSPKTPEMEVKVVK